MSVAETSVLPRPLGGGGIHGSFCKKKLNLVKIFFLGVQNFWLLKKPLGLGVNPKPKTHCNMLPNKQGNLE
jgi:hypothetical protein